MARSGAKTGRAGGSGIVAAATAAEDGTLDSVAMMVRVLDELALAEAPIGVTQLARQMGESKTRIYRYLSSLRRLGMVDQDPSTERYRLGWKLFQLGEAAAQQFDLGKLAEPYLKRLRDLTRVSALLSVPVNGEALVIASAEDDRKVSITVKPGNRPSAHASAQGRIVLAFSGPEVQKRALGRKLEAFTPQSITDGAAVMRRLARIRERLYDDAPNETMLGINALSAPVLRGGNELAGMIGIVGSIQDIATPPEPRQIELVRGCAAALSEMLQGTLYREHGIAVPKEIRSLANKP